MAYNAEQAEMAILIYVFNHQPTDFKVPDENLEDLAQKLAKRYLPELLENGKVDPQNLEDFLDRNVILTFSFNGEKRKYLSKTQLRMDKEQFAEIVDDAFRFYNLNKGRLSTEQIMNFVQIKMRKIGR